LDVAAQQVAVTVKIGRDTVEKLNPFQAFSLTDITRNTVESFVSAQKALMDVMAKPVRMAATEHKPHTHTKRPVPKHKKPAPVPVPA
jgi:hypothetical protein